VTEPLTDPGLEDFWSQDPTVLQPRDPSFAEVPNEAARFEIAAAIIVVLHLVRQQLQTEPDAQRDPSGAARRLWQRHAPVWLRLTVPAVRHVIDLGRIGGLSEEELQALATSYASRLGDYVSDTSADALLEGFDRQLAANWNERVAWQRATVGYGLDKREMRSYVDGLMHGSKDGNVDIVSTAARALVDKAMLRRADRVGRSESWTAGQMGQRMAWMWLVHDGRLDAVAEVEWLTREDELECSVCGTLDRVRVGVSEPFRLPNGEEIWSPQAHPGCRCRIRLLTRAQLLQKKADQVAGLCVRAADTGRVLMLQRALDPKDPCGGLWEFPGGHVEGDESPADAAEREWSEEVGRRVPMGEIAGEWTIGPYFGFVLEIQHESQVPIHRGRGSVTNPDDPDGDQVEQLAWWDIDQLARNPAVRPELRASLSRVRAALGVVDKAFDAQEPRDRRGRWSRTRSAPVADYVPENAPVFPTQPLDPYAAINPYSAAPYAAAGPYAGDPYAAPGDPYASKPSGSVVPTSATAGQRRRVVHHHQLIAAVKRPMRAAPTHQSFYMPVSDLAHYYYDNGRADTPRIEVDFDAIRRYYRDVRQNDNPIQAAADSSPWEMATLMSVPDEDWAELAPTAVRLWGEAIEPDVASGVLGDLDDAEVEEIAQRAGYLSVNFDASEARSMILDNIDDADTSDPSLREAYADYVTWQRPDLLGANGEEFEHEVSARLGYNFLERHPTPGVIVFDYGFGPSSGPQDVTGRFDVIHTMYRSAIAEFGAGAPPGAIGLQEFFVEPVHDSPPRVSNDLG
jgi:8-oxo-dGTP pyrophosphatase MutT (NUDIX family)